MERQKKKQKGITLIALVISIIVMLILAGVSLNMTIGENGIISQAQNATYQNSIAVLEEFFQQEYIKHFDEITEYESKLDGLIYKTDFRKYLQVAANREIYFIDSETYKEYYFIEKSALPKEIQDSIIGGEASLTNQTIYANFTDVYGITADLKIFYCSNGYDTWLGAEDTTQQTNLSKVVGSKETGWGSVVGVGDRDVTLTDLKALNGTLVINKSGLDLSFIVNIPNLKRVEFINCTYDSLQGLGYASDVTSLYFEANAIINDYSEVGKLTKLNQLYFLNSTDTEISKCFSKESTGIGNFDFDNLQYLAITSDDYRYYWSQKDEGIHTSNQNITTIAPITNLSEATKQKIRYMNISENSITSLEGINQFKNLYFLKAKNNNITSLYGIEGLKKLAYLKINNNKLGTNLDDENIMNGNTDGIHEIATIKSTATEYKDYTFENTLPELYYLDLRYNYDLVWVNYLKNCDKLKYLYLTGNTKINANALSALKSKINGFYTECIYDSKYDLALKETTTESLDLMGQECSEDIFRSLVGYTNLSSLNLKNVKIYRIVNGEKNYITGDELNTLINSVLSNFTKMQGLSLNGLETLSDISFVKNMTYINNIDLRNTAVITGATKENGENIGLELLNDRMNMYSLAINNASIDLSKIQATINRLGMPKSIAYPSGISEFTNIVGQSSGRGLRCENSTALATLSNCTEMENFVAITQNWGVQYNSITLDLTNCIKLKYWEECYIKNATIKMPASLTNLRTGPASNNYYNLENSIALEEIIFSENDNAKKILSSLRAYNTLTTLYVNGSKDIRGLVETVDNWSKCINLSKLDIKQVHWTSLYLNIDSLKFIEKLSGLENLTQLRMRYINVRDGDWSYLSNLSHLTNIELDNCSITDISCLETMSNINQAILTGSKVVNGLYALHDKTNLAKIVLQNVPIGDLSQYNGENYNTIDILLELRPPKGSLTSWNFNGTSITDAQKARMK